MVTQSDLIKLVMSNNIVLANLLIHLDLCGLIKVGNRLDPTLENSELVHREEPLKNLEIEDWIDDWRNLFMQLEPYKLCMGLGNRQVTIHRMKMFIDRVSGDVNAIFKATRRYLEDCKHNERLAKLPQYFILPQAAGNVEKRDIRTGDLYEWFTKPESNNLDVGNYDA